MRQHSAYAKQSICPCDPTMFQNQITSNGMPAIFPAQFALQALHQDLNSPIPSLPSSSENVGRSMMFSGVAACDDLNMEDELSDDGGQTGERKKRLDLEQVRTLERNFEMGNRLEPERKIQLARALGLQPRQIAIWFQNRRARWKTKQLEKDYDRLKMQFEAVKAENDALQAQNKKLHAEILRLKGIGDCELINLNNEFEACCSNRTENSSELNLEISRAAATTIADGGQVSQHGMTLFRTPIITELFEGSMKVDINYPKGENGAQNEQLCNVFGNMDDQSAFWAWSEHNNFR